MDRFGGLDLGRAISDARGEPDLLFLAALGRDRRSVGDPSEESALDDDHMLDTFQNGPGSGGGLPGGLFRRDVAGGFEKVPSTGFENRDQAHEECPSLVLYP